MSYEIRFTPASVRDIRKLSSLDQEKVLKKISELEETPRPAGSLKLRNAEDLFRIRTGDLRIIYQIHDDHLLMVIIRIARRDKVYR